jgi:hypothetical protein
MGCKDVDWLGLMQNGIKCQDVVKVMLNIWHHDWGFFLDQLSDGELLKKEHAPPKACYVPTT